jgi:hypothetical protein
MIDNTSVIRAYGTGADMVPAPEMVAFSQRFGFELRAHDKGHADRKGRVEAPFRFIQRNFLAGRNFSSLRQLNEEARTWRKKVNASYKKHIRAIPQELFAIEKPQLKALPVFIPEPEKLLSRLVDPERLVNVECNRYSVPTHWIGRQVQVRVTRRYTSASPCPLATGSSSPSTATSVVPSPPRLRARKRPTCPESCRASPATSLA